MFLRAQSRIADLARSALSQRERWMVGGVCGWAGLDMVEHLQLSEATPGNKSPC